ncbi:MAG: amidohydrolase family protein [Ardenticatenia bacterium]|nr:amidohydrolase family protein [Ardenticatenia bacterium]
MREAGVRAGLGDDWLRLGQIKIFADGTLGSRTDWMLDPFEGDAEQRGLPAYAPDELTRLVREAHEAGWPCAIHAIGDAANRAALDALEAAPPCASPLPDRIEHVQLIHPEDMPRLAAQGVVASMQPIHMASDWRLADLFWGPRARWSYAWRSLRRLGTVLAFGSDVPVESLDPWPALAVAITRQNLEGLPEGGWYPDETLTLAEALEGFTHGVARAAGRAGAGRVVVGAPADVIVLDQDPFELQPEELARARPQATLVGGEVVWGEM